MDHLGPRSAAPEEAGVNMWADINPARVGSRRLPRRPAIGYLERMKNALTVGEPRPDFTTRSNPMSGEHPAPKKCMRYDPMHREDLPAPSLFAGKGRLGECRGTIDEEQPPRNTQAAPSHATATGGAQIFSHGATPCPVRIGPRISLPVPSAGPAA
jgi:hypothetical protein